MQFESAFGRMAKMLAPYATGNNEATRTMIAKALMSSDPQKYLAPAMARDAENQTVQRIAEFLARRGAIAGAGGQR